MRKPIVVLDFDGVIHSYESGWKGADTIPDGPVPGAMEAIIAYTGAFSLHIYSARSGQVGGIDAMKTWIRRHLFTYYSEVYINNPDEDIHCMVDYTMNDISWPTEKPPALVTIDDRAIQFTGVWPEIDELANFKPWNNKEV